MKTNFLLTLVLLALAASAWGQSEPALQRMLEQADVRFYPKEGSWNLAIQTDSLERKRLEYRLQVYIKGYRNQTAIWTYPPVNKGDVTMKTNEVINLKQAKWPKPQILSYQAVFVDSAFSYGDIVSTNLSSDYTVVRAADTVEQGLDCSVLTLAPKRGGLYAKIEVVLQKKNLNTVRRTYFTASGEKEKESLFDGFTESAGRITGFHVSMKNLLLDLNSEAVISQIVETPVPSFMTDPQNIGRIHAK